MGKHSENANGADDRPAAIAASVTRATTIGQQIRLDIMSGRLAPGSKIHLEDLRAELLGVEALADLERRAVLEELLDPERGDAIAGGHVERGEGRVHVVAARAHQRREGVVVIARRRMGNPNQSSDAMATAELPIATMAGGRCARATGWL